MASDPGEISRRRVLAGVAWTTPAIVLAVSVPRAAASTLPGVYTGSFVVIQTLALSNLNDGTGGFQAIGELRYSVYNDSAAFPPAGLEAYQVQGQPGFDRWAGTWTATAYDSENNPVGTPVSGTFDLGEGEAAEQFTAVFHLPPGAYTGVVSVSSSQVATFEGASFTNVTPDRSEPITVT